MKLRISIGIAVLLLIILSAGCQSKRISTTQTISHIGFTIYNLGPITAGPDGNLWFTEFTKNKIDKISPITGIITQYSISTANAGPSGIAAGPDGNLWFTELFTNKIGKISLKDGIITEYPINNQSQKYLK
jgi:streptogramin lyase